jgi:hypothetical protein
VLKKGERGWRSWVERVLLGAESEVSTHSYIICTVDDEAAAGVCRGVQGARLSLFLLQYSILYSYTPHEQKLTTAEALTHFTLPSTYLAR